MLSKTYEKYIHQKFRTSVNRYKSYLVYICKTRKPGFMSCFEKITWWLEEVLDKSLFPSPVLMDLSKAFDCIPPNLLVVSLYAYSISVDAAT